MRRTHTERMMKKEFRMNLINRLQDLTPRERARLVEELVAQKYCIPFSKQGSISKTTIYRWLREFRESVNAGTALMGKVRSDKGCFRSLNEEQKAALLRWRYDNVYRTAQDLQEELSSHESTRTDPLPSVATIARFLRSRGLDRATLLFGSKAKPKIRLAFEAEYPQQVWMADTKGPDVYVIDPKDPSRQVLAKPIAIIDDHSRYIVAILYVIVENEGAVINLFRQAIYFYGIPEVLYLDRGGPYMGKSLKRAAALIGCRILHTPREDPASKGKIEKVLRTVHERFEHEKQTTGKTAASLEEYNQYLHAYIARDYHQNVHSSTGQTPEERFFALPPELRRWVDQDSLKLIFLPCRRASVSKTGLIRVNNCQYLAPNAGLWGKKVEVRWEYSGRSKVYVWYDDKYYGEAYLFAAENDFLQREALIENLCQAQESILPEVGQVPPYSRLERQLAQYREELEGFDLNGQLAQARQKKEQVRAALLTQKSVNTPSEPVRSASFGVDEFLYLLMKLLRKKFTPSEKMAVYTFWNSSGPIAETLVRKTVGELLSQEHPTDDIRGYLEEIRLALLTKD
jgi:transposase InsO family protein